MSEEKLSEKNRRGASRVAKDGQKKVSRHDKKRGGARRGWKIAGRVILVLLALSLVAAIGLFFWKIYPLLRNLPSPDNLTAGNERFNVASQIFDRHGEKLYEFYDGERRVPVDTSTLPAYVAQASIAIEDRSFYSHHGFDIRGIIRAFIENRARGETAQGGSTITQQLMKKALLTDEKSYERKIKEVVLAVITEMRYSKEQILDMYLNYISYGGMAVGIGSAADMYFAKAPADLTLAEAALLAGLPQAPSRYSPFRGDLTPAKTRQKEVLEAMVDLEFITQEQADEAYAQELVFSDEGIGIEAPHFVFYVRDLLVEKYGEEKVNKGGLRITTTLDLSLQETAQASLSAEITSLERYQVGNGAALVTKPNTGEILAMVGSRDYFDSENDGQVNVVTAMRQPGSSIKPLVYATAFEQRFLSPGSIILDIPTCFQVIGQADYCPKNYDGGFRGPVTVRQALANSYNIPAVKTLRMIGLESLIGQTEKMGISTWQKASNYGWSLSLGGGEVQMIDMAQAFGGLANGGVKMPLTAILKVEDYQGNVLEEVNLAGRQAALEVMQSNPEVSYENIAGEKAQLDRVLSTEAAYMTAHIMRDNNARAAAFGTRSELYIRDKDVAAKTGTTNDLRDNWTVGFTPEFLAITWVGNNDNSRMNPYLVSGVTGAAPIWNDIMSFILQDKEVVWPAAPEDVKEGSVCATGLPPREEQAGASSEPIMVCDENGENCREELNPNAGCGPMKKEIYWTQANPTRSVVVRENTWINPLTGVPPTRGEEEGLVLEEHLFYKDPLTDFYCVDCNRPVDENGRVSYERHYISEALGAAVYGD